MKRFAKIVATLGPSSNRESIIKQLIQAGMDVARLNFSHGTHESHAQMIQLVRSCAEELHKPITILQDLQGPKLRVGDLPKKGLHLSAGMEIYLVPVEKNLPLVCGNNTPYNIPLDVPNLACSVKPGNRILLDDGHLELEVLRVIDDTVHAKVVLGGMLLPHKGVNLPGTNLHIPGFTEKDRIDLEFGLNMGVDAVAISFVESAKDIDMIRSAAQRMNPEKADIPIIAKLERPMAIQNLHEILHTADGVMVARGDLGVEMSPSAVPIIQKEIIQAANKHGILVITATQMLDSMINNPRPTRAETSDVANAILDGSDAVMLSGETANGHYPVESVLMMDSIICEAEHNYQMWGHFNDLPEESKYDDTLYITRAARELAHDLNVAYITVFTQSGKTAQHMSKSRPRVPILALTPEEAVYHRLNLLWGVIPIMVPYVDSLEKMVNLVDHTLLSHGYVQSGQQVVVISGFPVGAMRLPNLALLHKME